MGTALCNGYLLGGINMKNHMAIHFAMVVTFFYPLITLSEVEVTGYLQNETAFHSRMGQYQAEAMNALDKKEHHSEFYKFENSARLFMNADVGDNITWHGDLNLIFDSQAHDVF